MHASSALREGNVTPNHTSVVSGGYRRIKSLGCPSFLPAKLAPELAGHLPGAAQLEQVTSGVEGQGHHSAASTEAFAKPPS